MTFNDTEAIEGDKLDALEEAIENARKDGESVQAELMQHALTLYRDGVFPDGSHVKRDTTRKDALKMLMGLLGEDGSREQYRIHFVLDAKVDDPRVSHQDVDEMFDDGTQVNVS